LSPTAGGLLSPSQAVQPVDTHGTNCRKVSPSKQADEPKADLEELMVELERYGEFGKR